MYDQIAVKTSMGVDRIHSMADTELPRPLRNLLIMVDDKSTVDKYRLKLKNYTNADRFGGVTSMFETLEDMELIQLTSPSRESLTQEVQQEPVTTSSIINLNLADFPGTEDFSSTEDVLSTEDYLSIENSLNTEELVECVPESDPIEDTLSNFRDAFIKLLLDTNCEDKDRYIAVAEGISNSGDLFRTIRLVWDNIRSEFTLSQRKRTRLLYHVAKKSF